MATSASQTYIAKLGFQDRDRGSARHGLACEYLFERLLELEVAPETLRARQQLWQRDIRWIQNELERLAGYAPTRAKELTASMESLQAALGACDLEKTLAESRQDHKPGECLNVPITSRSYVNGFADVLIRCRRNEMRACWLGEVKITQEPAENVLQQVNFYVNYLDDFMGAYILTDYDPAELKRLCAGTKIKVYRLGQRFEDWLATRTMPATEEL